MTPAKLLERLSGYGSLDGRTLVGVADTDAGEVGEETRVRYEQERERIYGYYAGGDVVRGHHVGTSYGRTWDVRYAQLNSEHETATGHSVGVVEDR